VVGFVPIFRSRTACARLVSILDEYRAKYPVRIVGYVIMPNHIHIAVWAENAADARQFINQMLKRSSMDIFGMTTQAADRGDAVASSWLNVFRSHAGSGHGKAIWKERGRAFPVSERDTLLQKLNYIHANPVRAGLVERAEDWEFSSASWYSSGAGPLTIDEVQVW
jgi:putative transposase